MHLRVCILLLGCTLCSAFVPIGRRHQTQPITPSFLSAESVGNDRQESSQEAMVDFIARGLRQGSAAIATVVVATTVLQPVQPSLAAQPTLNDVIVEVSETSYPIIRALDPTAFRDFSTKIGDLLLRIKPEKLGKSIELAIDTLDSASPEKLAEFNTVLKESYADLDVASCQMVPLPPMAIVDKFSNIAAENVDDEKLKTFQETWKPSLDALKKTDESICLPPTRASLDKLALAQADLARTFGKGESKAFASYVTPVLKQNITPGKALSLVDDAKKLAPNASPQAKKDFAAAGKKAEAASKLEVARNKLAEQKAKQAASKAALAKQ